MKIVVLFLSMIPFASPAIVRYTFDGKPKEMEFDPGQDDEGKTDVHVPIDVQKILEKELASSEDVSDYKLVNVRFGRPFVMEHCFAWNSGDHWEIDGDLRAKKTCKLTYFIWENETCDQAVSKKSIDLFEEDVVDEKDEFIWIKARRILEAENQAEGYELVNSQTHNDVRMYLVMARFMMKYPKETSVAFTCIKTIAADLVVQHCVDGNSIWKGTIDWNRTAVFGTFGFFYMGAFQYWLFNIAFFKLFPGVTVKQSLKKVCADQFVKGPFCYWPSFYFVRTLINEKKIDKTTTNTVWQTYKSNVKNDLKCYWSLWCPAQFITFYVMPKHLRLPFIATLSFFWCCFLSNMHGKYPEHEHEQQQQQQQTQIEHKAIEKSQDKVITVPLMPTLSVDGMETM